MGSPNSESAKSFLIEAMSHADEVPDVDVEKADQQRINLFGRLNNKKHFIESEIKDIKDKLSNYEDAQTEMMLLDDDDKIKYAIGDTYSCLDSESAGEMLDAEIEELQKQLEKQEKDMEVVVDTMGELKTHLYAKFGKAINL